MKRILRIIVLIVVVGAILTAIIFSSIKHENISETIWNKEMTLGEVETATRHYIVYTDLMCPYCNYYAKQIKDNDAEFREFLADHKILYEVRVTDMLYEGSGVDLSRPAAEGAYCAAREGKFWDYYHLALDSLFTDYYSRGIGSSKTAPKISDMTRDYWLNLGEKIGLGDTFKTCYESRDVVSEVAENTRKSASTASGLPYFVFGRFSTGGFDPTWEWDEVKAMLSAGL